MRWVYRRSDSVYLGGGDEVSHDERTQGVDEFAVGDQPDVRLDRHDAVGGKRPATPGEVAASDADEASREFDEGLARMTLLKSLLDWVAGKQGVPVATAVAEVKLAFAGARVAAETRLLVPK